MFNGQIEDLIEPEALRAEWPVSIDDVRIYNYALTAAQVKTLYNNGYE